MPETDVLPTITAQERAEAEDEAIRRATHFSTTIIADVWAPARTLGMTDEELESCLAREFSDTKDHRKPGEVAFDCGENKKGPWILVRRLADGRIVDCDPVRGKALLARARALLAITDPIAALKKDPQKYNTVIEFNGRSVPVPDELPAEPQPESNALAALSQAQQALARARTVDDVREVMSLSEAVRVVAQRRKLGLEVQNDATELRIRAERRAGEMIREMEKSRGGRPPEETCTPGVQVSDEMVTLSDLGITRNQSSKWQKVAAIDEYTLEVFFDGCRENGKEITTAAVLALNKPPAKEKIKPPPPPPSIQMWRYKDVPASYRALVREPEAWETVWVAAYPSELRECVPWLESMDEGMSRMLWGGLVFEEPVECDDGTILEYAISVIPKEQKEAMV